MGYVIMKKELKKCMFIMSVLVIGITTWGIKSKLYASEKLPLQNKTIIIDPGHGGWDPGKTGTEGENEKNINLVISQNLKMLLEVGGANVVMTRYEDEALGESKKNDMMARKQHIEESNADIMVSIHQNSYPSQSAKGAQTFYYKNSKDGEKLAQCIQNKLIDKVDSSNKRQAKENQQYYVLKKVSLPAVIVECGFLSNIEEERMLNDDKYQQKIAWAIYCGIDEYFKSR